MSSGLPDAGSYSPLGPGTQRPMYARPRRSRRPIGLCLALGCGGATLVVVAIVLVVGGVVRFGMGILAEQVKADLQDHPVIVQHLGRLESLDVECMASITAPGKDDYVFRARGTTGTGILRATCVTVDENTERVVSGTLQLESGEVVDLFPETTGS